MRGETLRGARTFGDGDPAVSLRSTAGYLLGSLRDRVDQDLKGTSVSGTDAGGIVACSRWLSPAAPPALDSKAPRVPAGCQPSRSTLAMEIGSQQCGVDRVY